MRISPQSAIAASLVAIGFATSYVAGQDFERGRSLYASACASCHGDQGEGVSEHHDQPLRGDLSIFELAEVIRETMPEDAPGSLSPDDARVIAAFVHHEFYSPMAQLRNAPPRVELAHLTVDQYRRSILDLMLPFKHRPAAWTDARGLQRTIHQGEWGKDRKQVDERVDSQLAFDWGDGKPVPEVDHEKWQVRWSGSLFAPVTGTYEFYLDASLRANLHVNNPATPLIDASVVSFEKSLNVASLFLIGGQSYPIALDIQHSKEPSSKVSLEWKPPGGVRQVIAARHLSPTWSPEQLVCSTPFPPDDSSIGYERGRNVSREWYEANVAAAIEVGNRLTADLKRWLPKEADDPTQAESVRSWCHRWVAIALRHRLSEEEKRWYVDQHFDGNGIESAVKRVCIHVLTSPEFLYPGQRTSADENHVAMLSLALWDSLPEEWMLDMAARGESHAPESLRGLVDKMIQDPRFQEKMRGFLREFLGLRQLRELSKDTHRFPEFDLPIAADLRESLELFLDEFATDPKRDLLALLSADYLYLNGRLAPLYGVALPTDAPFQKVAMPREQWSGILSHPFMTSSLAYHNASSPIHRGVFLARRVLGRALRPPVDAIIPVSEEAAPELTTRDRVAMQTAGAMCQSCHRVINPLGFALENYDALGRFRHSEQQREIDASGQYVTTAGERIAFRGVRELSGFLSQSQEVRESIARQMFQQLIKQPIAAYGLGEVQDIHRRWAEEGLTTESLARLLVLLSAKNPELRANAAPDQVSLN
jgi:cytochrome c553